MKISKFLAILVANLLMGLGFTAMANMSMHCESSYCVKNYSKCSDLKIWSNPNSGLILVSSELRLKKTTTCILLNENKNQLDKQTVIGDDSKLINSKGHYEFNNAFGKDGISGYSYAEQLEIALQDCESQRHDQINLIGFCNDEN